MSILADKKISAWRDGTAYELTFAPGEKLPDILRRAGLPVETACGGNGTCGKCTVIINGKQCLACKTEAQAGMVVQLPGAAATFEIMRHYISETPIICDRAADAGMYGIAADIGTTTLAFELFDMRSGTRLCAHSAVNSQRALGADVITRIQQAAQGAHTALHTYIVEDIDRAVRHMLAETGVPPHALRHMAVAGNTTMLHLLHDLPCDTLGVFPFTAVEIGSRRKSYQELFGAGDLADCEVLTLPGVSAFVGADIMAGLLCTSCANSDETALFIDLGTNGEMALIKNGHIWTASAAAGPAFEAGNISQGTGAAAGAVAQVRYDADSGAFSYETIGDAPPTGLCGTGAVSVMAELARNDLVDASGRLRVPDGIEIAPGISFTQKDVREMQLAKAAVRAGIEILLETTGTTPVEIDRVYLAGGFGFRLNAADAFTLGLLPAALAGNEVKAAGNTALGGAARVLLSRQAEADIEAITARAAEVSLAAHPRFNDLFVEYMHIGG